MAKENNNKKTLNKVNIIGRVLEDNTEITPKAIKGSLVIKYGDNADEQVEVNVYVSRTKSNSNEDNPGYDYIKESLDQIVSMKKAESKEDASTIRVYGTGDFQPEIGLYERYYKGNYMVNTQVSLGFGKIYVGDFDEDEFMGQFNMELFLKDMPERDDDDRLKVEGYFITYNGEVKPITMYAEDEELADNMELLDKGETIEVWGDIKISQIEETKTKKSGFGGKAKTETTKKTFRELIITGGQPIDELDERAVDREFVKKALVERENFLEELKEKEKKNKGSKKKSNKFTKEGSSSSGRKGRF